MADTPTGPATASGRGYYLAAWSRPTGREVSTVALGNAGENFTPQRSGRLT